MHFVERQRFRQPWMWAILVLFVGGPLVGWLYQRYGHLLQGRPMPGSRPSAEDPTWVLLVLVVVFGALCWLMWRAELCVEVLPDGLHVRFYPLTRPRVIPYAGITKAEARKYSPIGEYGGWGVRGFGKDRALNVSGDRGVQLELANGDRLLLGSQRAEELAAAIQARLAL